MNLKLKEPFMQQKVNAQTFVGQSIFVGIDVHAKDWKVSVMSQNLFHKTFSSPPSASKLCHYLVTTYPGADFYSAYEAGFSGFWLHRELTNLGIKSIVVNPADIPTTNKERNQKEDKRDSRKLAQTLRAGQLTAIYVPSEKIQGDRSFIRTRDAIVRDLTRTKNRIKSLLYFNGVSYPASFERKGTHWSQRFMKWLEGLTFQDETYSALQIQVAVAKQQRIMLLRLNRQIRELSRTAFYKENVDLLLSVPGVGIMTAMTLLTELEDIKRFKDFASICSFVGLIPSTHSSGESVTDTGITPRKNPRLRSMIIESAWIAIKHDPALLIAYENLKKKMIGNKAIIRIAKKLLNRIVFVLRERKKYEKGVIK